jgi:hypothetical protein
MAEHSEYKQRKWKIVRLILTLVMLLFIGNLFFYTDGEHIKNALRFRGFEILINGVLLIGSFFCFISMFTFLIKFIRNLSPYLKSDFFSEHSFMFLAVFTAHNAFSLIHSSYHAKGSTEHVFFTVLAISIIPFFYYSIRNQVALYKQFKLKISKPVK